MFGILAKNRWLIRLVSIVVVMALSNWAGTLLKPQPAQAATFSMQTGYYIGTGASLSLTGLGFAPELVMIKIDTAAGSAVFRSSAMGSTVTAFFMATADNTTTQIVLDGDGFTVGTLANVNTINLRYIWIAFNGSDNSVNGTFYVGTYTGDGFAPRSISTGFGPNLVWVKRSTAVVGNFRTSSMAANEGMYFDTTARNTDGALFVSLDSDGFTVGATNNAIGGTYYYVAFKEVTGAMDVGSYTGNGTDNTNIGGVGFVPDFVFVKNGTGTVSSAYRYTMINITESNDDYSSYLTAGACVTDRIQKLQADGFQIGSYGTVNENGQTFYYAAFGGAIDPPASGTFTMTVGSYIGTGVARSITGVGFAPDLVIIKSIQGTSTVFKTRMMAGGRTARLGEAVQDIESGAFTSLDSDGFSVSTGQAVNALSLPYHWQAFGNAFDPMTGSGAADFSIGAYTGSGTDDRNIQRTGFAPDLTAIKGNLSEAPRWRSGAMIGDVTAHFMALADGADAIQQFNYDGFQVGLSSSTNGLSYIYWFFSFRMGSSMYADTYSGDGTNDRQITSVNFQPNLVWVKRSAAVAGVYRGSSLTGDSTQYFTLTGNAANRIDSFISLGFQVDNNTEVNASGATYWYAAWKTDVTLGVTAPTSFTMPAGAPGDTTEYTFSASQLVSVTDGGAGWTLSVSSNAWTSGPDSIPAANIKLKTDGVLASEPTIITGQTDNVSETATGTYSLDVSRTISIRSIGNPGNLTYHRPTINVVIPSDQAAGDYVGKLTFTVV